MEYRECNKRIVTDLKYQAIRKYEQRGPRSTSADVFVGWNGNFNCHIVAVSLGPDKPASIRLMGTPGLTTKEQLIDTALEVVEHLHGKLIIYPEPHYKKPDSSSP